MACVIPFQKREVPAPSKQPSRQNYAFIKAYAQQWLKAESAKELRHTQKTNLPEEEILKLLRRIDRRLSKIVVA